MAREKNRYARIVEFIFQSKYSPQADEIPFERSDISAAARELAIELPKNLGDVLYSLRYRADLPLGVRQKAREGLEWVILPAGRSKYKFVLRRAVLIAPSRDLAETKIPDATPGIISMYALTDEQALLARIRYNRLVDIFMSLTCYSLQSHLRTYIGGLGQIETDEIYVGLDKRGAHYVLPLQAKGRAERIGVVQIEQDIALCQAKFANLFCRPLAAQLMDEDLVAMFALEQAEDGIRIAAEKHYRLVPPEAMSAKDLELYASRPPL